MSALAEVDFERSLKIIIVGNGQVGKTSMITRFARGTSVDNYKKTIGTDFMEKDIIVRSSGDQVKLMLWDTAGQEMFSQLTRAYYKGSGGVIFVFSTVDRDSFDEIERWQRKVKEECGDICSVLVQNKCDLIADAVMSSDEVEALARRMNTKLFRACVKENHLVDEIFDYVSEQYIESGGDVNQNGDDMVPQIGEIGIGGGVGGGHSRNDFGVADNNNNSSSSSSNGGDIRSTGGGGVAGSGDSQLKPFTLGPSKRRTNGKKASFCTIL